MRTCQLAALLFGIALPGVAESPRRVVVSLPQADSNWPEIQAMREETARLLAPAGYQVEFTSAREAENVSHFVLLTLQGDCRAPERTIPERTVVAASSTRGHADLGTSAVSDGHVLPFATVHCAALSQMLGTVAPQTGTTARLYGRSLGRIVAHELDHILADEIGHYAVGASKGCFRIADLLNDQFHFEEAALRKHRDDAIAVSRSTWK